MARSKHSVLFFLTAVLSVAALIFTLLSSGLTAPQGQNNQGQSGNSGQNVQDNQNKNKTANERQTAQTRDNNQSQSGRPSANANNSRPNNTPNTNQTGNTVWRQQNSSQNMQPNNNAVQNRRDNAVNTRPNNPVWERRDNAPIMRPNNDVTEKRDNKDITRLSDNTVIERRDNNIKTWPNNNNVIERRDNKDNTRLTDNTVIERRDNNIRTWPDNNNTQDRRDNKDRTNISNNTVIERRDSNVNTRPNNTWERRNNTPGAKPDNNNALNNTNTKKPDDNGLNNQRKQPIPMIMLNKLKQQDRVDKPDHNMPTHKQDFRPPRKVDGFYHYDAPRFNRPFNYGYWILDVSDNSYCHSPFFYFGLRYLYEPRVVVVSVPSYTYVSVPSYDYDNSYYLSQGSYSGLTSALDDIKNTWLTGKNELIERHLDPDSNIAIYLDGKYSYTLPGTDYRDMTLDAMKQISTIDFTIYKVAKRSDGAYTAFAKHTFCDADNKITTVYVSYTLTKSDGVWLIIAAGSSNNKLN